MIQGFASKGLELLWLSGKSKKNPDNLKRRILMKLEIIDAATCTEDLKSSPGNHFHSLKGDFKGYYAISVSGPWRLIFKFSADDCASNVRLIQYHYGNNYAGYEKKAILSWRNFKRGVYGPLWPYTG